jgi:hypothetical protein
VGTATSSSATSFPCLPDGGFAAPDSAQFIDQRSEQGQLPQVVQALVYQSLLVSLVLLEQIEVEQPVFVAAG